MYFFPRYFSMVLALAGDSTTTSVLFVFVLVLVFAFGAFFIDVYYNWPAFIIEEPAIEITETTDNLN